MAQIHVDSELMTNYQSAVPAKTGSHFITCLDPTSRRPMVFCLSNDDIPKLQILEMIGNAYTVVDLGAELGIPATANIQAFDVQQGHDLRIYITVAVALNATTSTVNVYQPEIWSKAGGPRFTHFPSVTLATVHKLMMGPAVSNVFGYPMVLALHQRDGAAEGVFTANISRIVVDVKSHSTFLLRDLQVPVASMKIFGQEIDLSLIRGVAPAVGVDGVGLYVLYDAPVGQMHILAEFVRPNPVGHSPTDVLYSQMTLAAPTGSTAIASVVESNGQTGLLISHSNGLQYLDSSCTAGAPGKLICSDDLFHTASTLLVAQDATNISIWAENSKHQLVYLKTSTPNISQGGTAVALQDRGNVATFSAAISGPNPSLGFTAVWQFLMIDGQDGTMQLLQQCADTGLWNEEPFYIGSNSSNVAIQSFSVNIYALDDRDCAVPNASVFVQASSSLTCIANGQPVTLNPTGAQYPLDFTGELALIIATTSPISQTLTISNFIDGSGKNLGATAVMYNPTDKLIVNLKGITGEQLGNAKTQNGTGLFDKAGKPSAQDLDTTAKCLSTMHDAYQTLKKPVVTTTQHSAKWYQPMVVAPAVKATSAPNAVSHNVVERFSFGGAFSSFGDDITHAGGAAISGAKSLGGDAVNGAKKAGGDALNGAKNVGGDAINGMKDGFDDASHWVVDQFEGAYRFTATIAGEAKSFVLDCVEKVGAAFEWVWGKIKLGIEDLIEWIGYLFGWKDILNTKNTISSFLNAGFEWAAVELENLEEKVEDFFDNLQTKILKLEPGTAKPAPTQSAAAPAKSDDHSKTATKSTSFNWAGERVKNGGSSTGAASIGGSASPADSDVHGITETVLKPGTLKLSALLKDIGNDVQNLVSKDPTESRTKILAKLGDDILLAILQIVKDMVVGILKIAVKVVRLLEEWGNRTIDIPIFSALYKFLTGSDLTIIDLVSLVIAIPMTILSRIATGHAPPTMPCSVDANLLRTLYGGSPATPQPSVASTVHPNVSPVTPQASAASATHASVSNGTVPTTSAQLQAAQKALQTAEESQAAVNAREKAVLTMIGRYPASERAVITKSAENAMAEAAAQVRAAQAALAAEVQAQATPKPVMKLVSTRSLAIVESGDDEKQRIFEVVASGVIPTAMVFKNIYSSFQLKAALAEVGGPIEGATNRLKGSSPQFGELFFLSVGAVFSFVGGRSSPGYAVNATIGAFTLIDVAVNAVVLVTGGWNEEEIKDVKSFDFVVAVIRFLLTNVVVGEQLADKSWRDYDIACSTMQETSALFNIIQATAGLGAWQTYQTNPIVAIVCMCAKQEFMNTKALIDFAKYWVGLGNGHITGQVITD